MLTSQSTRFQNACIPSPVQGACVCAPCAPSPRPQRCKNFAFFCFVFCEAPRRALPAQNRAHTPRPEVFGRCTTNVGVICSRFRLGLRVWARPRHLAPGDPRAKPNARGGHPYASPCSPHPAPPPPAGVVPHREADQVHGRDQVVQPARVPALQCVRGGDGQDDGGLDAVFGCATRGGHGRTRRILPLIRSPTPLPSPVVWWHTFRGTGADPFGGQSA